MFRSTLSVCSEHEAAERNAALTFLGSIVSLMFDAAAHYGHFSANVWAVIVANHYEQTGKYISQDSNRFIYTILPRWFL